jgi:uncharacterized protein YjbJ (UPF0337 family)
VAKVPALADKRQCQSRGRKTRHAQQTGPACGGAVRCAIARTARSVPHGNRIPVCIVFNIAGSIYKQIIFYSQLVDFSRLASWPADCSIPAGTFAISEKGVAMNWDMIEGNWKQYKGKVKEQWGKLTDDHLDSIAGKRDQLVGKIQETYGINKDEAENQIKDFEDRTWNQ